MYIFIKDTCSFYFTKYIFSLFVKQDKDKCIYIVHITHQAVQLYQI